MTTTRRLAQLGLGVMVFHVLNSVLQEAVFQLPGFNHSVLLTLLQSVCIAIIAFAEMKRGGAHRKAPMVTYILLSIFSTGSNILTNEASRLLNYPTQVLFKSSKLLVVMLVRAAVFSVIGSEAAKASQLAVGSPLTPASRPAFFRRQFLMEVFSGVTIVFGIVTFTYATSSAKLKHGDASATSTTDVAMGIGAIVVAMLLDALLYIFQERYCFKAYEASENEVIFYLYAFNTVNSLLLTLGGAGSGNRSLLGSFSYMVEQPTFSAYVAGFSLCNFLGTHVLLKVVSEFDSNAAVVITSIRKVLTIIASYIIYPKPVGWLHVAGGVGVFLGVYLFENARLKAKEEKEKELRAASRSEVSEESV